MDRQIHIYIYYLVQTHVALESKRRSGAHRPREFGTREASVYICIYICKESDLLYPYIYIPYRHMYAYIYRCAYSLTQRSSTNDDASRTSPASSAPEKPYIYIYINAYIYIYIDLLYLYIYIYTYICIHVDVYLLTQRPSANDDAARTSPASSAPEKLYIYINACIFIDLLHLYIYTYKYIYAYMQMYIYSRSALARTTMRRELAPRARHPRSHIYIYKCIYIY